MEACRLLLRCHRRIPITTWRHSTRRDFRLFSSGTSATTTDPSIATTTTEDQSVGPELLLYERKTDASVTLLRSGLFFSTIHTIYWSWYVTDFVPLINSSPAELMHIDPLWGYAGLSIAIAINAIFVVYPKRFVSKIVYRPKLLELAVYSYQMPLMRPSTFANRFPVGDQAALTRPSSDRKSSDYFRLDDSHAKAITDRCQGDISKFRGYLTAGGKWPRYSIDIQSSQDVVDSSLLMEILLTPEYFQLEYNDDDEDDDEVVDYSSKRFRRNKRSRAGISQSRRRSRR